MASLKTNIKSSSLNRGVLNTTIDKNILEAFKMACKTSGIPMNTLIESFMKQYTDGDFRLILGNSKDAKLELE